MFYDTHLSKISLFFCISYFFLNKKLKKKSMVLEYLYNRFDIQNTLSQIDVKFISLRNRKAPSLYCGRSHPFSHWRVTYRWVLQGITDVRVENRKSVLYDEHDFRRDDISSIYARKKDGTPDHICRTRHLVAVSSRVF